jgi:short-chain Z-isoprenyl diphosphate synthase
VEALTRVLSEELERLARHAASGGAAVRSRVFRRLDAFQVELAETARRVQSETGNNGCMCVNVALGYSGRDELVAATRRLVWSVAATGVAPAEMAGRIDAEAIGWHLLTAVHTDPDLIIRTSGELRLGGFVPSQGSQSEFSFTDVFWPAFRELDFLGPIRTYQRRERRSGR